MKKYILVLFLIVVKLPAFAQAISFDIFGDLQFKSSGERYNAYLKKDIFNALVFTDSQNNELVFEQKYLQKTYPGILLDKNKKIEFFKYLIVRFKNAEKYKAQFKVDIFDKIIIEDSNSTKIEMGKDIFGNETYSQLGDGLSITIKTNLNGNLEYTNGDENATLSKSLLNKYTYTDSSGNSFEISSNSWKRLSARFGKNEDIFIFLINNFLNPKLN